MRGREIDFSGAAHEWRISTHRDFGAPSLLFGVRDFDRAIDLARKDLAVYEVSKGPTPKEGESEYTEHVKDFHYFRVLRVKVNSGIEK
jgi:hypothetical protein